jgi:Flp pilus assembly protein CpaB
MAFGTGGIFRAQDQPDVRPGLLPVGSRAIELPIAAMGRVASHVKPGVRVDISARDQGRYKGEVVVRDARVLSVADQERSGERQVVFQVSPLQARVLDLLLQTREKLSISLREQAAEQPR